MEKTAERVIYEFELEQGALNSMVKDTMMGAMEWVEIIRDPVLKVKAKPKRMCFAVTNIELKYMNIELLKMLLGSACRMSGTNCRFLGINYSPDMAE